MLFDFHCHPQLSLCDGTHLVQREDPLLSWQKDTVHACCTRYADIQELKRLHVTHPNIDISVGLHPWFVQEPNDIDIEEEIQNILAYIVQYPCGVGEIGVDNSPKYKPTLPRQIYVFERILQIATTLQRPITIHSVRSHHIILALLAKYPKTKIYLHRFQGNDVIMREYQRHSTYALFGVVVDSVHPYGFLPMENLALESDGCIHREIFYEHLQQMAVKLQISTDRIIAQQQSNYHSFFTI